MKRHITNIYEMEANMAVELPEGNLQAFEDELLDTFVTLVEKHRGYCGGGFQFKLLTDEELK